MSVSVYTWVCLFTPVLGLSVCLRPEGFSDLEVLDASGNRLQLCSYFRGEAERGVPTRVPATSFLISWTLGLLGDGSATNQPGEFGQITSFYASVSSCVNGDHNSIYLLRHFLLQNHLKYLSEIQTPGPQVRHTESAPLGMGCKIWMFNSSSTWHFHMMQFKNPSLQYMMLLISHSF